MQKSSVAKNMTIVIYLLQTKSGSLSIDFVDKNRLTFRSRTIDNHIKDIKDEKQKKGSKEIAFKA